MQVGLAFPRILQEIWGADPVKVPIRVSKLDVTDAYHCGTLRMSQVGAFTYIVPSAPDDDCIIICVDLVLPMEWVDSTKFFCTSSKTLIDVSNALVDMELLVPAYGVIYKILSTVPGLPHTRDSLTHINWYMDNVISMVQVGI